MTLLEMYVKMGPGVFVISSIIVVSLEIGYKSIKNPHSPIDIVSLPIAIVVCGVGFLAWLIAVGVQTS